MKRSKKHVIHYGNGIAEQCAESESSPQRWSILMDVNHQPNLFSDSDESSQVESPNNNDVTSPVNNFQEECDKSNENDEATSSSQNHSQNTSRRPKNGSLPDLVSSYSGSFPSLYSEMQRRMWRVLGMSNAEKEEICPHPPIDARNPMSRLSPVKLSGRSKRRKMRKDQRLEQNDQKRKKKNEQKKEEKRKWKNALISRQRSSPCANLEGDQSSEGSIYVESETDEDVEEEAKRTSSEKKPPTQERPVIGDLDDYLPVIVPSTSSPDPPRRKIRRKKLFWKKGEFKAPSTVTVRKPRKQKPEHINYCPNPRKVLQFDDCCNMDGHATQDVATTASTEHYITASKEHYATCMMFGHPPMMMKQLGALLSNTSQRPTVIQSTPVVHRHLHGMEPGGITSLVNNCSPIPCPTPLRMEGGATSLNITSPQRDDEAGPSSPKFVCSIDLTIPTPSLNNDDDGLQYEFFKPPSTELALLDDPSEIRDNNIQDDDIISSEIIYTNSLLALEDSYVGDTSASVSAISGCSSVPALKDPYVDEMISSKIIFKNSILPALKDSYVGDTSASVSAISGCSSVPALEDSYVDKMISSKIIFNNSILPALKDSYVGDTSASVSAISGVSAVPTLECATEASISVPQQQQQPQKKPMKDIDKLLSVCGQKKILSFDDVVKRFNGSSVYKLGEGVFSEVFCCEDIDEDTEVAIKVMPIEGKKKINNSDQKRCHEVVSEIVISSQLSKLSQDNHNSPVNSTDSFIKSYGCQCIKGKFPKMLLKAWDTFDKTNNKNDEEKNKRPTKRLFGPRQLHIMYIYECGGRDMEFYNFHDAEQGFCVLHQIVSGLAVAEKSLNFEHRDLHWGNVLVNDNNGVVPEMFTYTFGGVAHKYKSFGTIARIIDFTLSRFSHYSSDTGETAMFHDLADVSDIFEGDAEKDYQFEIYRKMRKQLGNCWEKSDLKTNIFWIDYLLDKLIKKVIYVGDKESPKHLGFIRKMEKLRLTIDNYSSASHLLQDFFHTDGAYDISSHV